MHKMQETWVRSLGQKDALEKEMTPHSRILAWKIPWTEEPGRPQTHGATKSQTRLSDWAQSTSSKGSLLVSLFY